MFARIRGLFGGASGEAGPSPAASGGASGEAGEQERPRPSPAASGDWSALPKHIYETHFRPVDATDGKKSGKLKRVLPAAEVQSPGGHAHIEADVVSPGGSKRATDRLESTPNGSFASPGGTAVRSVWHRRPGVDDSPHTLETARQLNLQADNVARKKRKKNPEAAIAMAEKVLESKETKKQARKEEDTLRKRAERAATPFKVRSRGHRPAIATRLYPV